MLDAASAVPCAWTWRRPRTVDFTAASRETARIEDFLAAPDGVRIGHAVAIVADDVDLATDMGCVAQWLSMAAAT